MKKRFLHILIFLLYAGFIYAQGWTFNDGTLNVTGQIWVRSYEFGNTHPSTYNGTPYSDYHSQIKTIILSDNITYVGQGAFTGCTVAERLVVGKGVKTYAYNAFYFPKSTLKTIEWNAANADLTDQYNGYVSKYNQGPFGVREVWMDIDDRNYAANAETIIFGPDVVTIPNYFAYFMKNLKKVEFGAKVTSIGMYAFVGITANTVLIARMPNPASVTLGNGDYNPFPSSASDRKKITLKVPAAYVSKYKAANIWKDFNIVAINKATVTFIDADGNTIGTPQEVEYGQSATAPTPPTREGYTFVGWIGSYQNVTADATIFASYEYANQVLNGVFSVSETEAVQFSPGNLQYHATAGSHQCADGSTQLGVWRFAEHQWDMIGSANTNVSSSYANWIDLFGWGTSGYHNTADIYNTQYNPYSTSSATVNEQYNYYGYGPSMNQADANIVGTSAYYDWGVYNAIFNGGKVPEGWRTLSWQEMEYLLNERANAANLKGVARVNGVNGAILLPDHWLCPDGITFQTRIAATNHVDSFKVINNYTLAQWKLMENAGAVFLPCAGGRGANAVISSLQTWGHYWTTTASTNSQTAYDFRITSNSLSCNASEKLRRNGFSVRLVKDVPQYTITTSATNGTVTGGGAYNVGAIIQLTATPAECYQFIQWSDGNKNNPRTITVSGNATYTAEFEKISYTVKGQDAAGGHVEVENN